MKLTILKEELNEAIQHVSKAVSGRTTIPILSGIKLEAESDGMVLTASDTDISIQSFIPAKIDDEAIIELQQRGSVVLPAKFFVEIIRKLPDRHVEIQVTDNFLTFIRSGKTEIQMVGMDPEEFPILPQLDESRTFSMNGYMLKSLIRQTTFAVSANEATPILTGALWTLSEGRLKIVATDRHRLSSSEAAIDASHVSFHNVVISGKTLNELARIIPDQHSMMDIVVTDNQVLFKMDRILFFSRILDGNYPDTSKIIPQSFKTELILSTKQLTEAIDRAYLLSREDKTNIVKLTTGDDGTIEISSSSSEIGKVTEQLNVGELQGEPLRISFNSKYMLDALKVIDSEEIHIGFTGTMSPIIVRPKEDGGMLHLILPYRTTN